jgi:hypothetical protein
MNYIRSLLVIGLVNAGTSPLYAQVVVHTTDFIPNNLRTNFNSFEALPAVADAPPGLPSLHIEDGVRVEQIASRSHHIVSLWWWSGNVGNPQPPDGARSWYPSAGDTGYSRITREDGSAFERIGFMRGSGNPNISGGGLLLYELYDNGGFVLGGSVSHTQLGQYLGFSGGGFDEIRVRDGEVGNVQSFYDHTLNALALDAIELSNVPEPSSLLLLVIGLIGLGCCRRRSELPCAQSLWLANCIPLAGRA